MLELLLRHRRTARYPFDILALHVDGAAAGLPDARSTLEPWLRATGVDYAILPLRLPDSEPLPLNCHRCAWNRRKALFQAASAFDCGKVALGHHADDAAVTTLMNLLFNGRLETMAPNVVLFDGAVTVIRPLIYAEEKRLAYYRRVAGYPELPSCPMSGSSERTRIEGMMRGFGSKQKMIRSNLWRAARRHMGF